MRHSQLFRFVLSCFTVHTPDSEFGRALDLAFIHTKNLGSISYVWNFETGPECFAIDASERLTLCILLCFVYAYTISGSLPYWDSCANFSHIQSFWRKFLAPRGADFSQKAIIVFPLSAIRGVSKSQLSRVCSGKPLIFMHLGIPELQVSIYFWHIRIWKLQLPFRSEHVTGQRQISAGSMLHGLQ